MITLKRDYISIDDDVSKSYGGNQSWWESKRLQSYGCGLIAATDVMLYLGAGSRIVKKNAEVSNYTRTHYRNITKWFAHYFHVLPLLGMSGLLLRLGFNRCCRRLQMPYKMRWGAFPLKFYDAIEEMLNADIPVILSVGPNFPFFWKKEGVMLYTKNAKGEYIENQRTRGHYVTVTGIDDEYLQISSWGKCYYMRREEYDTYRKKHSIPFFTSICYIKKTA